MSRATGKQLTCVQRIEVATVKKTQVIFSEAQSLDAEALFNKYDVEGTQLLSRGALTELLRDIGLEEALGSDFGASSRLAFDAHSADSHFLSLAEFKQLYYLVSTRHPKLLPRPTRLKITIMGARGLPPADANGKADPYCSVQVIGKPSSRSTTRHIDKTLDPWWGEEFDDKYGYDDGDKLLFECFDYDKGSKGDLLCRATLDSSEFHRAGGFDGKLTLVDGPKAYSPTLKVRVTVNGLPAGPPNMIVRILSAKALPPTDANGKADPFCIMQLVGKPYSRSQTKVLTKTLEPTWDEEFDDKHRYEEGDSILFEVRDYDGKGKPADLLGRVTLPSADFHKEGGFKGTLTLGDCPKGFAPSLNVQVNIVALEMAAQARTEALAEPAVDSEVAITEAANAEAAPAVVVVAG